MRACVRLCVSSIEGASGLCLPDIGGPCTPMMLLDKDCCLCSHKSSLSLSFTLSLLSVLPLFSHPPCWVVNGVRVRAGVSADTSPCPWPLASIQAAHDYERKVVTAAARPEVAKWLEQIFSERFPAQMKSDHYLGMQIVLVMRAQALRFQRNFEQF